MTIDRILYIPFLEYWKEKMLNGKKTCTSRVRKYGNVGSTFKEFGATFEITDIKEIVLGEVGKKYYKQEGCDSLEQFVKIWTNIHPKKGFVQEQKVFLHLFKRVT